MELVIQHGAETGSQARVTASVLELFALGLPGFCVFFLATRAFQAMQDTRTAFVCYALENGTNVLMAIVLYGPLGVRGLAIAYSVAYTVAAIVAVAVLHERLGRIGGRLLLGSLVRSVMLCAAMALAVAFVEAVIGTGAGLLGWVRLFVATGAGVAVYLGGAGLAGSVSAWQTSRRRPLERRGGSRGRHGRHSGSH